jgi:chorismate dehydratase
LAVALVAPLSEVGSSIETIAITVTKLRISVVQYLNTTPLIRGFTHGHLQNKYDLSFTVPSQCAEALRTGAADIAIIPAIEYQRIVSQGVPLTILPGLAIASKERVRSLLVISKVPIRQAHRIALDPSSRSTQALVKILAAKRWQISPEFFEPPASGNNLASFVGEQHAVPAERPREVPSPASVAAMLQNADAALIIGDAALRIAITAEAIGLKPGPDAEWLAPASVLDSMNSVVGAQHRCAPSRQDFALELQNKPLHIYDVVKEWWHLTEKPAVLAVWAVRNDSFPNNVVPSDLAADFLASRDFGLTQIPQIVAESAQEMDLPAKELRLYLEKNIDYTLDPENLKGLQRFWALSSALGITGPLQSASIAASANSPTRHFDFTTATKR